MKVDRSELSRLAALGGANAIVMATLYVLKPIRSAVFLDRLGVAELPWATIAVAVVGTLAGSFYGRLAGRVSLDRLVLWTFLAAVALLLGFRGGLGLESEGRTVIYAFFIAVALISLVTTSLVWLLANEVFDAREARRLFGFLGATGIAGAIAGGVFTKWAVHALGSRNLVTIAAAMLAASLVLIRLCPRPPKDEERRPRPKSTEAASLIGDITGSDLLRGITFTAAIGGLVSVIADIQFNDAVGRAFATRDEKAAFLGLFSAALSGCAFFVQLVVTPRVLGARGVGPALLFLPIALGGGSLALLLVPSLVAAASLKLTEGGLRHSIHKSASEILVAPLPPGVRARTRLFLDTSVGTASEAVGAAIVLLLTRGLAVSYPALGVVSIVLVAIWIALTTRAKAAYVGAFRRALERRELDLADLRTNVVDPDTIATLTAGLVGNNERASVYALDMLSAVRDPSLVVQIAPLLEHRSAEVRKRAVRALRQQDDPDLDRRLTPLLRDVDAGVRAEAMLVLGANGRFRDLIVADDIQVRAAVVAALAAEGTDEEKSLVDVALLRSILDASPGEEGSAIRAQIAGALGGFPQHGDLLRELTLDPSPEVVGRAIGSAGRTRDEGIVAWLVERLGQARYRMQAREALASFGVAVVPRIAQHFDDEESSRAILLQLPRVLAEIPHRESVDVLERLLASGDSALVLAATKALAELSRASSMTIARKSVEPVLERSLQELAELGPLQDSCAELPGGMASQLLGRAVRERRATLLDRVFRLLGLIYPSKEMNDAYHGVLSRDRALRAHALEFLHNIVDRRFSEPLCAAIERASSKREVPGANEILSRLVGSESAWLRACTVAWAARGPKTAAADAAILRSREDPAPIVRDAARVREC